MNKFDRTFWGFMFACLAGITVLSACGDKFDNTVAGAAKAAGHAVAYYCDNVQDEDIRVALAEAVNSYASPHSITISCAEGGPALRAGIPIVPTEEIYP